MDPQLLLTGAVKAPTVNCQVGLQRVPVVVPTCPASRQYTTPVGRLVVGTKKVPTTSAVVITVVHARSAQSTTRAPVQLPGKDHVRVGRRDVTTAVDNGAICRGGAGVHTPAAHSVPAAHRLPHEPQFEALLSTSTQAPLHNVLADDGHAHTPLPHVPPVQVAPQPPQLAGSVSTLMQTPPQFKVPLAQHTPPRQLRPDAHAFAHAPQFVLLVCTSTHVPLHNVVPVGHVHTPPEQVPPVQRAPHAPQFAGSLCVATHTPEQLVLPNAQQRPKVQWSPLAQAVPQAPQWLALVAKSTQAPVHNVLAPAGQRHTPLLHVPPAQALPHALQFAVSEFKSVHTPPHAVCPVAQHTPLEQICPAVQALPQVPQFDTLVCTSTQVPLHEFCPLGHAHDRD